MLDAQPYQICFSWRKTAKRLYPMLLFMGRLDFLHFPKQVLFSPLPASTCAVCVLKRVSLSSIPFSPSFPPSEVFQCPCCSGGVDDPPPLSPPGLVQGPDFHFNSRLSASAEASPLLRLANKEPTVHGRDVQPALTSPPSSMGLFSPGTGLVGVRLPAPGNTPLVLGSPSLSPLRSFMVYQRLV